jgi:hypothetical protein
MNQIEEIFIRLSQVIDIKNNTDLANFFGVSSGTVRTWKSRGEIPYEQLISVSKRNNLSLNWLLLGEEKLNTGTVEQEPEAITKWLSAWWSIANSDERAWMRVQMKRCFPEYLEWLKEEGDN